MALGRPLVWTTLLLATPAWAVDLTGVIKGTVSDLDGLPVPAATVTVSSTSLQGTRDTTTDGEGDYRVGNLPPGDYLVRVDKASFESRTVAVRLPLGTTLQVDVALPPAGHADEEIEVLDAASAVDVESTRTGAVLSTELLRDLPGVRDYQSALGVAPGVVGTGNANVHGGFETSNQFYIDGVNTTDPVTNTFNVNMNYDVIESVQVITGGMDAEYGRSLGGVVNIVTKSGGNQHEGTVNLVYQAPTFWLAPRRGFDPPEDEETRNRTEELALTLGGPVIKDKLWYFGALQLDRSVSQTAVPESVGRDLERFPMLPRDWRSAFWFAKLTAQPTPAHRLWVHFQGDPTWIDNVGQDPYTLPSAETFQFQGGWLGSLGHTWTPSEVVSLQTQVYYQPSLIHFHSQLWNELCDEFDPEDRRCLEELSGRDYLGEPVGESWFSASPDGFNSGEFPYSELARRYRASLTSALTLYGDLLGEHTFQVGLQAERLQSRDYFPGQEINGLAYATLPDGADPNDLTAYEPSQLYLYETNWDIVLAGTLISPYIQDVYQPHERLTLRPGLRLDYSGLAAPAGTPVFSKVNLAPRFGVAFDLTGDARTSTFFSYGRFYDAGFLQIGDILKRAEGFGYALYNWDPEREQYDPDPVAEVGDAFLEAGDLRTPYSDEFNLGIRHGFGPDWSASVTLIHEEAGRFWEDDEVNQIWNADGTEVIGGRNGDPSSITYRMRTPDSSFTTYQSVEVAVERAWARHWTGLASYTWSRAYGTNSYDQASALLDNPEQRKFEIGLLDHDTPHALKTAGAWSNPDLLALGRIHTGPTLGWNLLVSSGTPYRELVFNDQYGSFSNFAGPSDGAHRLPTWSQLDLRAMTAWRLDRASGADPTASAGIEVFNVLNTRTVTAVRLSGKRFGDPLDYQARRSFQIVARGSF